MRLNASKIGLFAGLLGAVTGQEAAAASEAGLTRQAALIDFGSTFPTPAVFSNPQMDVHIIWTPVTNFNLAVTVVYLYMRGVSDGEDDILIAESDMATDFVDISAGQKEVIDSSETLVRRDSVVPTLQTFLSAERTNVTVLPINSEPGYLGDVWNSHVLYMEFNLRNGTHTGKGYSPPFVVIDDDSRMVVANQILMDEPNPVKEDQVDLIVTTTDVSTGSSSPPTPSPTSGSPSVDADLDTPTRAAEAVGGRSGARLSTGAIAGIVVGICVGFLAVAGVSVWFCLRRRQSGRPLARTREVGYGSDSGAVAMMPEKEAAGLTESSSHPVYDHPSAPVDHHGDPTAMAASYAPYSDHMVAPGTAVTTPTATSLNEPSPVLHEQQQQGPGGETGAARQHQQQPIASRYAHLVEEGMTEEEIRRLEEEERQLDAAIEEAGHRQSQARQ
ncbi:hypothetical protein DL769_002624 [Monosporascus sp. CRB-8-3]|nr:hypothetical protein DL769_002624 [Monosporascus sp. CRB-8-3]